LQQKIASFNYLIIKELYRLREDVAEGEMEFLTID